MKETFCLFKIFHFLSWQQIILWSFLLFASIFYERSYAVNKSNLIFMTWNFATSKKDSLSGTSRFQIIMVWYFLIVCNSNPSFSYHKGQSILKAKCQAVNSSKKRTNEFIFTTMRNVFVRFLGEIEDTNKPFEITWTLIIHKDEKWKIGKKCLKFFYLTLKDPGFLVS